MSEWGIALIAAGSAVAGSLVTGWYSRSAGVQQAEAARHAGDRQADALLETVRLTLHDQAVVHMLDVRRQTYLQFLDALEAELAARSGRAATGDAAALRRALAAVTLQGPPDVAGAAEQTAAALRRHNGPGEAESAKDAFIAKAQAALRLGDTGAGEQR
jgi:hypothetical protein